MGKFIVIDGGEGAGKGTVIRKLQEILPAETTVFTREPGGSALAEEIRSILLFSENASQDPIAQFLLFWAARANHLKERIRPSLLSGKNVICDRFDISTYAYQIRGYNHTGLLRLFEFLRDDMGNKYPLPDLYIYLDIDPEIGLSRKSAQGEENNFERTSLDFHKRVREGYHDFFSPSKPWARSSESVRGRIVDASLPIEEVLRTTIEIVISHIGMSIKSPA